MIFLYLYDKGTCAFFLHVLFTRRVHFKIHYFFNGTSENWWPWAMIRNYYIYLVRQNLTQYARFTIDTWLFSVSWARVKLPVVPLNSRFFNSTLCSSQNCELNFCLSKFYKSLYSRLFSWHLLKSFTSVVIPATRTVQTYRLTCQYWHLSV